MLMPKTGGGCIVMLLTLILGSIIIFGLVSMGLVR